VVVVVVGAPGASVATAAASGGRGLSARDTLFSDTPTRSAMACIDNPWARNPAISAALPTVSFDARRGPFGAEANPAAPASA
jgi:hypothetical protein